MVVVPKICWCGDEIMAKVSKSVPNPYRRYYRCAFAASSKVMSVTSFLFSSVKKFVAHS